MDRLEPKLLGKILGLVRKKDQRNVLRVSKKWCKVMDELVGIDVRVGRGTRRSSSAEKIFDSSEILGQVGIRSCQLDDFVNDKTALPKLKQPNLLKVVSIYNFVSSRTLESLLTGVIQLHTFKIGYYALFHMDLSDKSFTLPCQVLEIFGVGFSEPGYEEFGATVLMEYTTDPRRFEIVSANLLLLLRQSFPGLKRLKLKLRVLKEMYEAFKAELLNFLNKHADTLTELNVGRYKDAFQSSRKPADPPTAPKLDPIRIPARQLTKLRNIEFYRENKSSGQEHWMKWVVVGVTDLEKITFKLNYPEDLIKSIVSKNERTLQFIHIQLMPQWKILSFDCEMLRNCTNLRTFKISMYEREGDWDYTTTEKTLELLNTESLPRTTVELTISGLIRLGAGQYEAILRHLPQLNIVDMVTIGSEGVGVPSHVLRELLMSKKFQHVYVRVDKGTEDYSACTSLAIHDHRNERHNPGDTLYSVYAAMDYYGEYEIHTWEWY